MYKITIVHKLNYLIKITADGSRQWIIVTAPLKTESTAVRIDGKAFTHLQNCVKHTQTFVLKM